MSEELIIKALEEIDSNFALHWQVIIQESILHIYINREIDEQLNYAQLVNDVSHILGNLDDVWQGYWLYSRILGEIEPEWQNFITLKEDLLVEESDNLINDAEELGTEIQETISEDSLVVAPELENNSLEDVSEKEVEHLNELPEEVSQKNVVISIKAETNSIENVLAKEPENIEPETETIKNLSQYCFIRNRKLLSSELVAPHLKIANLVQSFHELSESDREVTASLLNDFFKLEQVIEIEDRSIEIKTWWEQFNELNDEEKRKAAIWLSRYCCDRDITLSQIQSVFDFETAKKLAERESTSVASNLPVSIQTESKEQNTKNHKTEASKNQKIKPQQPTPSHTRINLLIPIVWLLITIFFIALGVNSANSDSLAQENSIPPICQNITETESLDYCQLAVAFVGNDLLTEIQQESIVLSPIDEVDALELTLVNCEQIANLRAGVPKTESNSRDGEALSSHSQNLLPGIYIAEATQNNFKESSKENPTIRIACVYSIQNYKRQKLQLVSYDLIPTNWPEEAYQGKTVIKDIQAIDKALGIYSVLIFMGTGTLFTAIGLFIASMFNLGITIYSIDALYRSAFILGIIETIFIRPKMHFFGMFIDLAVQTIVLGITGACVKGLKIHWSDGYLVVALGAITVFGTKRILHYLLIIMIAAFIK